MAIRVQTSVTIARPVEQVSNFVVDLENESKWFKDIVSIKKVAGETGKIGARYERVFNAMGKQRTTTVSIAAYEPNKRVVVQSAKGPVTVTGTMVLEPVAGGTKLNLTVDAKTSLLLFLAKGKIRKNFQTNVPASVAQLKQVLESLPAPAKGRSSNGDKATAKPAAKKTAKK